MITDMTQGNPAKMLVRFSLPLLGSVVFQQLYNIVDSVIAGRFIGEDALAAVGASYPVTMIFMAIGTGMGIGCSVVISQLFGAKSYKDMKTAVTTSVISTAVLSAVLTALGLGICGGLMRLLNTPRNIFADSRLYLNVYTAGLLFMFMYNVCTGIFTALGDSKTPLYFLICSSVGNIFLDLIFVKCFGMGVGGVAWATFIAQGVSSLLAAAALKKRIDAIPQTKGARVFSAAMLGRISVIAVPSILQQSFISVGNLFIQGLVNSFGSAVIAGYSAAIKLNTFAIMSFTTLSNGLSSFTAQNMGAGNPDRVKKGFWAGMVLAVCVAVPFTLAYTLLGKEAISLFMQSESVRAAEVGRTFLIITAPFYPIIVSKLIGDAVLRGSGKMLYFMIATFSDLVLRVVLSFVFARSWQETGIWLSWPVGWLIATVISMAFYFSGVWKKPHGVHR